LVPPFRRDTLIQNICALYADIDKSRVIAVIGARGGVGASTIAHNLAWSIAELQHAHTTLFDLDLPFGAIGFGMRPPREDNVSEMLAEPASIDDALLDRITTHQTQHLQLLTAPARLERAVELDPNALQSLLARVRRTSSFVVLDLPHAWNSWIKQTLASADDVIIVAGPDLASLRNAKNMLDMLSASRPHSPPIVALSMTGVPDRPEIQPKEFAEAIDTEPLVSFAFEPGLFGMCAINNQMIGEAAPYSKAALSLDLLAATVTGRKPAQPKAPPRKGAAPARVFANAIVGAAPVSAAFAAAAMQEAAPEAQAKPAPATAAPEVEGSAAPAEFAAPAPAAQARRAGDMPSPAWRTERRRRAAPPHRTGEQLMLPFEAEEPDEELDFAAPPLELVREARAPAYVDYYARAREAALHDLIARENVKEEPDLTPRRQFARIAAGALTVAILGGAWHVHSQRQTELTTEANAAITHEEPAPPVLDAWADETARYAFAIELLEVGRAQEAATLLRRTAEDGFPMAQYRLAKLYERGEGVEADLGLARQWTERAAGGGNRRAMHDLGVYYARGEGAMLDDSTAFRWFRLAAEFGVADSQYNLGLLYQQGRGVAEDAKEALFWFLVAAAQGDEAAIARVAIVEAQLTPLEVEQARARARAFHARPGNPIANGEFAARAEPVIEGVFEAPAPAPAPEAASSDG
jgi:TPR repeat protein/cellulose biosynthesis protein BcsQ